MWSVEVALEASATHLKGSEDERAPSSSPVREPSGARAPSCTHMWSSCAHAGRVHTCSCACIYRCARVHVCMCACACASARACGCACACA